MNVHDTLNSHIDIGIDQGSQFNQNLFTGDLAPRRPEDDELMADLTEDELKAAFRLISLPSSYFISMFDVSVMMGQHDPINHFSVKYVNFSHVTFFDWLRAAVSVTHNFYSHHLPVILRCFI